MTNNNSHDMKTVVETYLVEETVELIYDGEQLDRYNQLVAELGITTVGVQAKDRSPIPFLHMKDTLVNTFETLCPAKRDLKDFDISPIPVEILELVALSKREKYFSKIQVWYDDKNPDPVVVGFSSHWHISKGWTVESSYGKFASEQDCLKAISSKGLSPDHKPVHVDWGAKKYLIGRWGDVKQSFKELRERAIARFVEEKGVELRQTIKNSQRDLDDLELNAMQRF